MDNINDNYMQFMEIKFSDVAPISLLILPALIIGSIMFLIKRKKKKKKKNY